MMHLCTYFLATGQITMVAEWDVAPGELDATWFDPSLGWVENIPAGVNTNIHYVSGSPATVTPRPEASTTIITNNIMANGSYTAVLSSIPVGALVTVLEGVADLWEYTVNDGVLEMASGAATSFDIVVYSFPELESKFKVVAI